MVFSNESSEASSGYRGDVADDDPNGSAGPALMRSDLSEGPEVSGKLESEASIAPWPGHAG
jgi:hypothetical protein